MLYHLRQDNIWRTFWEVFCLTDDSGPDTDNPGVWIPESPMAGATSFRNDQKYVGYWSVKKTNIESYLNRVRSYMENPV